MPLSSLQEPASLFSWCDGEKAFVFQVMWGGAIGKKGRDLRYE